MTLEEFIRNFNKTQSNKGEMSYRDYLGTMAASPEDAYRDALGKIEEDYQRARIGYGAEAEAMAGRGLTGSGYAAYLDGNAYAARQRARTEAKESYHDALKESARGYGEYLEKFEAERFDKIRKIESDIADMELLDPDAAYDYATSMGLSHEDADMVAMQAIKKGRQQKKEKLLSVILRDQLSSDEAMALGLYHGLSESEIKEISHFAKLYVGGSLHSSNIPQSYRDLIQKFFKNSN